MVSSTVLAWEGAYIYAVRDALIPVLLSPSVKTCQVGSGARCTCLLVRAILGYVLITRSTGHAQSFLEEKALSVLVGFLPELLALGNVVMFIAKWTATVTSWHVLQSSLVGSGGSMVIVLNCSREGISFPIPALPCWVVIGLSA